MKVKIEIEADNDEMHTWEEIAYAIARRLEYFHGEVDEVGNNRRISDRNGNTVGSMEVQKDDDESDEFEPGSPEENNWPGDEVEQGR